MILPAVLCFLIGIAFVLIGIFTGQKQIWIMGIIMGLAYPIAFIVIYGPMAMLMSLIYNLMAGKFGGLELTIKEEEPTQPG
jgi:cell shape-determining protein MreD